MEHDEKPTTLLRTVKSVLERANPKLLAQIIIVDDCSDVQVDSEISFEFRSKNRGLAKLEDMRDETMHIDS